MPKVEVAVQVHDGPDGEGNVVSEQRVAANLATDNLVAFWKNLITPETGQNTRFNSDLTNVNGVSNSIYWTQASSSNGYFWVYTGNVGTPYGGHIGVGDGGGASVNPQRSNVDLDNRLGISSTDAPSAGTDTISASASVTNNSGGDWTIREVGFFMGITESDSDPALFLMFHDSIAEETVTDGQSITVTYEFTWP